MIEDDEMKLIIKVKDILWAYDTKIAELLEDLIVDNTKVEE